jgi:hypothetical protein
MVVGHVEEILAIMDDKPDPTVKDGRSDDAVKLFTLLEELLK